MEINKMRTIQTILYDGNPNGVKTTEFTNRLTKGIYIPRINVKNLIENYKIEEYLNAGIYFLIGENEEGEQCVYIGQATNLNIRINQHNNNQKDEKENFREIAIVFTTKENSLNESDINYLERECIIKAQKAKKINIINQTKGNNGCLIALNKKADLNEFIFDMEILLGNLGFDFLKQSQEIEENSKNIYYITSRGSQGKGQYTQDGFIVYKGSRGPKTLVDSCIKNKGDAFRIRPKLKELNIIKEEGDEIIFLENYTFRAPSTAANIIIGRNSNGREVRKNSEGKTLGEIERGN